MEITKTCTKCKEDKTLNHFRYNKTHYENICKKCQLIRQQEIRQFSQNIKRRHELTNTQEAKLKRKEYHSKKEVKERAHLLQQSDLYKIKRAIYENTEKRKERNREHAKSPNAIKTRQAYNNSEQGKEKFKSYKNSEKGKLVLFNIAEKYKSSEKYAITHLAKLLNLDKEIIKQFPEIIALKQIQLKTHRLCQQLQN